MGSKEAVLQGIVVIGGISPRADSHAFLLVIPILLNVGYMLMLNNDDSGLWEVHSLVLLGRMR